MDRSGARTSRGRARPLGPRAREPDSGQQRHVEYLGDPLLEAQEADLLAALDVDDPHAAEALLEAPRDRKALVARAFAQP